MILRPGTTSTTWVRPSRRRRPAPESRPSRVRARSGINDTTALVCMGRPQLQRQKPAGSGGNNPTGSVVVAAWSRRTPRMSRSVLTAKRWPPIQPALAVLFHIEREDPAPRRSIYPMAQNAVPVLRPCPVRARSGQSRLLVLAPETPSHRSVRHHRTPHRSARTVRGADPSDLATHHPSRTR